MYGEFIVPPEDAEAPPRCAVLAQGRLLHRLRARHHRVGGVGGGQRPGRGAGDRQLPDAASPPAHQLGLSVTPAHLGEFIALGREIKWALNDSEHAVHPTDPRLSGIYGTI
jgi:hypothetical protein